MELECEKSFKSLKKLIPGRQDKIIESLITFSNQNSGSYNFKGLQKMSTLIRHYWDNLDIEANYRKKSLELTDSTACGNTKKKSTFRECIFIEKKSNFAKRKVLLAIHYDTVFDENSSFQNCQRVSENYLKGPGVVDAKSGILILLESLYWFEKTPFKDNIRWQVMLNPDEEIGSIQSKSFFPKLAEENQLAFIFEPSLPSGNLVSIRKGSVNYRINFFGRSAHAGREIEKGRNSVVAMADFIIRLQKLHGSRPGLTINMAKVSGGTALNVVPKNSILEFNLRFKDSQDLYYFEKRVLYLISAINKKYGVDLECNKTTYSPPKSQSKKYKDLLQFIKSTGNILNQDIKYSHTGGVCDGNKFAGLGLLNMDTLGAIGTGIHSEEETLYIPSINQKIFLTTLLLMRLATEEFSFFK